MKKLHYYLAGLGTLAVLPFTSLFGAPMISVGNNADIFFNGLGGISFNDNVTLDADNEISDAVFRLKPGVEFAFGRGATNADVNLLYQYDILRYTDNNRFNNELHNVILSGTYEGAKFSGEADFSFIQNQSNTQSVNIQGDLIETDRVRYYGLGEYQFSPKTSFRFGGTFLDLAYKGAAASILPDREIITVPLDVFYELTPKLDIGFGYRYRDTKIEDQPGALRNNPLDHLIRFNMRGEFTPKLAGSFSVGYQARNFRKGNIEDTGGLSLEADLDWEVTPKFSSNIELYSDYSTAGSGESIQDIGFNLSGQYAATPVWYVTGNVGYNKADYDISGRDDDLWRVGIGANWVPNDYLQVAAGYTYRNNDSTLAIGSYNNNVFNVTASLRY